MGADEGGYLRAHFVTKLLRKCLTVDDCRGRLLLCIEFFHYS